MGSSQRLRFLPAPAAPTHRRLVAWTLWCQRNVAVAVSVFVVVFVTVLAVFTMAVASSHVALAFAALSVAVASAVLAGVTGQVALSAMPGSHAHPKRLSGVDLVHLYHQRWRRHPGVYAGPSACLVEMGVSAPVLCDDAVEVTRLCANAVAAALATGDAAEAYEPLATASAAAFRAGVAARLGLPASAAAFADEMYESGSLRVLSEVACQTAAAFDVDEGVVRLYLARTEPVRMLGRPCSSSVLV